MGGVVHFLREKGLEMGQKLLQTTKGDVHYEDSHVLNWLASQFGSLKELFTGSAEDLHILCDHIGEMCHFLEKHPGLLEDVDARTELAVEVERLQQMLERTPSELVELVNPDVYIDIRHLQGKFGFVHDPEPDEMAC